MSESIRRRKVIESISIAEVIGEYLAQTHIDTGGEFIFLPARELREDQGQRE
jgi:hypothetical protein